MLGWLKWLFELLGKTPTVALLYDPPTYSFLPEAWLLVHEVVSPPLRSRIGVRNFGSTVLRDLRIKLWQSPDYPIEGLELPGSGWRYVEARNEIQIDEVDPDTTLTFFLFFDQLPDAQESPHLLCGGLLVGARSEWLWLLNAAPREWAASAVMALVALGLTASVAVFAYQQQLSPEARAREDYFNSYASARGLKACNLRTLNADQGEVHEGEIARNMNGIPDALLLNRSSSLEELLKRKRVFVCVAAPEK